MSNYIIGYDLNRPRGQDDYPKLFDAIKQLGSWWHHLDSTWIVATTYSAVQIRDHLSPFIDSGDELLVARLSGEAAWNGFDEKGSQWLKTTLS
jgi:hypothetical protein